MPDIDRELCNWPTDPTVYLTLDFECDFGTALTENHYDAVEHVHKLVTLLEQFDIPLTAFIQTELLEVKPEAVEELRTSRTPVSFHPHSHTHKPRDQTSIADEIARSTEAYESFFSESSTGYRFPNGNVRPSDYKLLEKYDYEFDASVFPSWRPNHFDNTDQPTQPHYLPAFDLIEVPFTVYSDRLRIPTALSYARLIGEPYTALLNRRPPKTIIFNVHVHDIITPKTYAELSPLYKMVYARNDHGLELLRNFLRRRKADGYRFCTLDQLLSNINYY